MDMNGRILFSKLANNSDYQLDVSELMEGIYVVKASNLERKITLLGKVVKLGK